MSDTFGAIYIQGQQIGLPGGGSQSIGPYGLPASGVQETVPVNLVNDTVATTVPTSVKPIGVLIVPPVGGAVAFSYKTVSGDTGIYANPQYPSWLAFDPAYVPTTLYLVSAGTVSVILQFI